MKIFCLLRRKSTCINTLLLLVLLVSCKDNDEVSLPEVTEIVPAMGIPGAVVVVKGRFFSGVFSENIVTFTGVQAIVTSSSATQLNVIVPAGITTGPVDITVNGRPAANHPNFTVLAIPPVVTKIAPLSGRYNTQVTIEGDHFLSIADDNIVSINGVQCRVESATESSLTVRVPARAGVGPVIVNGVVSGFDFEYIPEVFVGGFESNGSGFYTAEYWKDGQQMKVSAPAGQSTLAEDMKVVGNDVYLAGHRVVGKFFVAQVWKNGVQVPVTDENHNSTATRVLVDGNDIYVTGTNFNSKGIGLPTYWKNGIATAIAEPLFIADVTGIAVVGNDIHLSGNIANDKAVFIATYWKNGVAQALTTGAAYATNIYVDGTDVYVTGLEYTTDSKSYATYWKNGVPTRLTSGLTYGGLSDIKVVNGDVYAVGTETIGTVQVGKYWKNGVQVLLGDGSVDITPISIDVVADDIFICGSRSNGKNDVPTYWKNGVPYSLSDAGNYTVCKSIAVR